MMIFDKIVHHPHLRELRPHAHVLIRKRFPAAEPAHKLLHLRIPAVVKTRQEILVCKIPFRSGGKNAPGFCELRIKRLAVKLAAGVVALVFRENVILVDQTETDQRGIVLHRNLRVRIHMIQKICCRAAEVFKHIVTQKKERFVDVEIGKTFVDSLEFAGWNAARNKQIGLPVNPASGKRGNKAIQLFHPFGIKFGRIVRIRNQRIMMMNAHGIEPVARQAIRQTVRPLF